jgi:MurNAc alpha-1-phosphate uridylyltransferase
MLQIVILAGGLAQRLRPVTERIPKALIDVNGKPFIDWQLNLLARRGILKVVLCVSYKSEMIKEYVGDGSRYKIEVKYSEDGIEQLGTGGAIKKALPLLNQEFMVLYGDSYLDLDYASAQIAFQASELPAMMTVFRNMGKFDTGNAFLSNSKIERYEKGNQNLEFQHIDYGLNFFNKKIFETDSYGNRFDLAEVCQDLAKKGKLAGFEVLNRFYEVGSLSGIVDLSNHLRKEHNVI